MFRILLMCALTLADVSSAATAIPVSSYSLSCTGGVSIKFENPHVWNTGSTIIPAASKIEVLVAGQDKPVVTALIVALKPGETFITGGKVKPPYKCTARVL
jgi:hypothetical protein